MKITVVNHTSDKISSKPLQRALDIVLKNLSSVKLRKKNQLKLKKELVLIFLTEAEMKKVNFQFRKKNKPTDVLSFQSDDELALGELLFCLPVLKKQAKVQKHTTDAELLYMMIHGVLHLLGYDHELSAQEEKLMFQIQDRCFEQVRHLAKVF